MTYQNLLDTAKRVLKGKFIAMKFYIFLKNQKFHINNLMIHY
jgi:hypothetical protein